MATCKLCKRSGIFFKVNSEGLCEKCYPAIFLSVKSILRIINESVKLIDESKNLKTRINRCEIIIQRAEALVKYEEAGINTFKPTPSEYVKFYTHLKQELENSKKTLPPSEIYSEYPLGIRCFLLMYYEDDSKELDYFRDIIPYRKESSRLGDIIVGRNVEGIALERSGQIDEAIELYEKNISDLVDTPHPYERLRIIYTKQKKFSDAIRVCQANIQMSKLLAAAVKKEIGDAKLAKQLGEAPKFVEHISKLKLKT